MTSPSMTREALAELALKNGEVTQAANGTIAAITGERTGRSPKIDSLCVML